MELINSFRAEPVADPLRELEKIAEFHDTGEFEACDGSKRGRGETAAFTAYGTPSDLARSNRCFEVG